MEQSQSRHKEIMQDFLQELNQETNSFILKGGTALLFCYGLDRFSEDIDLDCEQKNLHSFLKRFGEKHNLSYRVAKDTPVVKRYILNYDENKTLKIEVSYRNKAISPTSHKNINGIEVYNLDRLCQLKTLAYINRDKLRDLYDLSFICNKHFNKLSDVAKTQLQDALSYKGLEHFDYIMATQHDRWPYLPIYSSSPKAGFLSTRT